MERTEFDFAVKHIKCIPEGTKEACVIVREFLQTRPRIQAGLHSAVTTEEFLKAVKTLMAYSWENRENDCVPEFYHCDNDCSNIQRCIFCPGEYQLAGKDEKGMSLSKKLCPHFRDPRYE